MRGLVTEILIYTLTAALALFIAARYRPDLVAYLTILTVACLMIGATGWVRAWRHALRWSRIMTMLDDAHIGEAFHELNLLERERLSERGRAVIRVHRMTGCLYSGRFHEARTLSRGLDEENLPFEARFALGLNRVQLALFTDDTEEVFALAHHYGPRLRRVPGGLPILGPRRDVTLAMVDFAAGRGDQGERVFHRVAEGEREGAALRALSWFHLGHMCLRRGDRDRAHAYLLKAQALGQRMFLRVLAHDDDKALASPPGGWCLAPAGVIDHIAAQSPS